MGVINIIEHCHAIKEETETQRDKVLMSRSGAYVYNPADFLSRPFFIWLIILKATHWCYNTKHFLAYYLGREIGNIYVSYPAK